MKGARECASCPRLFCVHADGAGGRRQAGGRTAAGSPLRPAVLLLALAPRRPARCFSAGELRLFGTALALLDLLALACILRLVADLALADLGLARLGLWRRCGLGRGVLLGIGCSFWGPVDNGIGVEVFDDGDGGKGLLVFELCLFRLDAGPGVVLRSLRFKVCVWAGSVLGRVRRRRGSPVVAPYTFSTWAAFSRDFSRR